MTHSSSPVASPAASASTAELVKLASTQISSLVRDEIALARAEMTVKARNAGVGAGMIGGAGVLAAFGAGALLFCAGLLLALVMPAWLAALIVAIVLYLIAGMLVLLGRSRLRRATPPMPAGAIAGLRADMSEVTEALHRGQPQREDGGVVNRPYDGGAPGAGGPGRTDGSRDDAGRAQGERLDGGVRR